jgi:hypothetical protein
MSQILAPGITTSYHFAYVDAAHYNPVTATIASAQGSLADVASPFAAGGCKNLPFHPQLTASTRRDRARLTLRSEPRQTPQDHAGAAKVRVR